MGQARYPRLSARTGRRLRAAPAAVLLLGALLLAALAAPAHAQNMEQWYREGMAHLEAGRKAQAQAKFLAVLAEIPDHFRSMCGLAQLYLDAAPVKSLEYADAAIRAAPGYERAHYLRGLALEKLERPEEAADAFRQVIVIDPRHTEAHAHLRAVLRGIQESRTQVQQAAERFWADPNLRTLTLFGQILLREAKPEEAVAELEKIPRKLPNLPEANLWLARAQRAAGNVDGEQEAYRRYLAVRNAIGVRLLMAERLEAIGRYRSAMEILAPIEADAKTMASLDRPERGRVAYLRSRSLRSRNDFARVGEQLVEAGKLGFDPERIDAAFREELALHDGEAALWLRAADWRALRGDAEGAADARAQACRANRSACGEARRALEATHGGKAAAAVTLALGEVAMTEGRTADALVLLKAVPPGEEAFRRAQLLQGLILRAKGDTTGAVDALMRYVFLFPDRGGMLYARGTLFWELGDRDVAVAVWRENPDVLAAHPELLARLAAHLQTRNDPNAERVFREELAKAQPDLAQNHERLGDLYRAAGMPAEAQREWLAALQRRPRDAALILHLAQAFIDQGNTAQAATLLRQAWQLQDLPPALAVTLARYLEAHGDPKTALQVYWQVHQDAPAQPEMREALPELALRVPATQEQREAAAKIALETSRPKLAENLLVAALQEAPADPDARRALADFYRQQGQPNVAERVMSGNFHLAPSASAAARPVASPPTSTAPASQVGGKTIDELLKESARAPQGPVPAPVAVPRGSGAAAPLPGSRSALGAPQAAAPPAPTRSEPPRPATTAPVSAAPAAPPAVSPAHTTAPPPSGGVLPRPLPSIPVMPPTPRLSDYPMDAPTGSLGP